MPTFNPTTALEVVHDFIVANTTPAPVDGTNMFIGYAPDTSAQTGMIYEVLAGFTSPKVEVTFGSPGPAFEVTSIDIQIRSAMGNAVSGRNECARLRYLLSAATNYTSGGLRMMWAEPMGSILPVGKDQLERSVHMFTINAWTDSSYA